MLGPQWTHSHGRWQFCLRLQGEASKLANEAQSPAPEAARSLKEASEQMEASQQSLARGENDSLAQQAALDALSQAEAQLEEQVAALEKAKQDLNSLQRSGFLGTRIILVHRHLARKSTILSTCG